MNEDILKKNVLYLQEELGNANKKILSLRTEIFSLKQIIEDNEVTLFKILKLISNSRSISLWKN